MSVGELRPSRVIINKQNIADNISQEISRLNGTEMFAVIKANAYGHGMVEVANIAKDAGATGFCVALIDEALDLRKAGFQEPILVLGLIEPRYVNICVQNNISIPVGSIEFIKDAMNELDSAQTAPLHVHLALDTGMGRIGFTELESFKQAVRFLLDNPKQFDYQGIFTHFSTADEKDTTYFDQQVKKFNTFLEAVDHHPKYIHVSNSATSLWHAACNGNMIRFGVAIYGLNPSGNGIPELPYQLKPALSLTSELVFIKQMHEGEGVSYGATYRAKEGEWVGTVPIGYADGWLRRLQGSDVLINGQRCQIIGRICMDQFMVRLPEGFPIGTPITLIGRDQDEEISIQDVADYSQTIHYEVACNLTNRLPRVYV